MSSQDYVPYPTAPFRRRQCRRRQCRRLQRADARSIAALVAFLTTHTLAAPGSGLAPDEDAVPACGSLLRCNKEFIGNLIPPRLQHSIKERCGALKFDK